VEMSPQGQQTAPLFPRDGEGMQVALDMIELASQGMGALPSSRGASPKGDPSDP